MEKREDFGSGADQYFADMDASIQEIGTSLRALIINALPGSKEVIKWGVPVYEKKGLVCSLRGGKGYVALQFFEAGVELDDPDNLLEGTGQKMRHVKVRSKAGILKNVFSGWVKQAAKLNA